MVTRGGDKNTVCNNLLGMSKRFTGSFREEDVHRQVGKCCLSPTRGLVVERGVWVGKWGWGPGNETRQHDTERLVCLKAQSTQ